MAPGACLGVAEFIEVGRMTDDDIIYALRGQIVALTATIRGFEREWNRPPGTRSGAAADLAMRAMLNAASAADAYLQATEPWRGEGA